MRPTLQTAANGHLTIDFNALPESHWEALTTRLMETGGFHRIGQTVMGLDEAILPSFQRAGLTLAAGWNIWSGHYLLSECAAGDEFLRTLFSELGNEGFLPPV